LKSIRTVAAKSKKLFVASENETQETKTKKIERKLVFPFKFRRFEIKKHVTILFSFSKNIFFKGGSGFF
jgi:hypothetical protein